MQVHEATSCLTAVPASPEDFADLLGFLEKLEERRHGLDNAYDHVRRAFQLKLDCNHTRVLAHKAVQCCLKSTITDTVAVAR